MSDTFYISTTSRARGSLEKSISCYDKKAVCWFGRSGNPCHRLIWLFVLLGLGALGFSAARIHFVPNNCVEIVEKRFSVEDSVKAGTLIALNKEAGYQLNVLGGGRCG